MTALPHDDYNARRLTEEDVARTFVLNEHFLKLLQDQHTLLIGPRGSGKTTLFKMLTSRALAVWQHPEAARIRKEIAFRAVYVAADVQWAKQIEALGDAPGPVSGPGPQLSRAAVATNVFLSFLNAVQAALETELSSHDARRVASFATAAIPAMRLPRALPSIDALRLGLKRRASDIEGLSNELKSGLPVSLPRYVFLDFMATLVVLVEAFEQSFPEAAKRKWALCFDELEIAPEWLNRELLALVRGTNPVFRLKLCTSPTPRWPDTMVPAQGHDFRAVFLARGQQDEEFMSALASDLAQRRLQAELTPVEVFGLSPFAAVAEGDGGVSGYSRGSREWELFRELAQADPSLSRLLGRKEIDPADPTAEPGMQRDAVLRKMKPIALLRREYRDEHGKVRSRKLVPIYCGWDVILRMSEGNPRWLLSIVDEMIAGLGERLDLSRRPLVEAQSQARILRAAAERHATYLRGLPELTFVYGVEKAPLWPILERLGKGFHRQITQDAFPLDPVGSFTVDTDEGAVSDGFVEALRVAEYHGAVVSCDYGRYDIVNTALRGRAFRLAFLLSPKLGLPVRQLASALLSTSLRLSRRASRRTRARRRPGPQPELPSGD